MINKNGLKSALVTGFGAAVVSYIPLIKFLAPIFTGFIAGYLAVKLYLKAENKREKIKVRYGFLIGWATAFFTAIFSLAIETIFTYIFKSNDFTKNYSALRIQLAESFKDLPENSFQILDGMVYDIQNYGFSILYLLVASINFLIFYSLFCSIGGVLSLNAHNLKTKETL
jgi:predicted PurR-regulated permease PerM